MKNFTPNLYITPGGTNAMWTLRKTVLRKKYIPGPGPYGNAVVNGVYQGQIKFELSSEFVQNLSIDAAKALAKAERISVAMGIPLRADPEKLAANELRDIERAEARTPEQIARERREAYVRDADRTDYWLMLKLTRTPAGRFTFGKYEGKTWAEVNEIDRQYLEWMAETGPTTDSTAIQLRAAQLATWLEKNAPAIRQVEGYVGNVGDKLQSHVTVTRVQTIYGNFGPTLMVKMLADSGHALVAFYSGSKWQPDLGWKGTLAYTVKKHSEYKGHKETVIKSPKEVAA